MGVAGFGVWVMDGVIVGVLGVLVGRGVKPVVGVAEGSGVGEGIGVGDFLGVLLGFGVSEGV